MNVNAENFNKYSQEMLANGFSSKTLHVDAWALELLERSFKGKRFEQLTKDDLIKFFAEAPSRYRIGSIHLMKARVKHFFAWLYGCEPHEYPAPVKWIRTNNPGRGTKTKGIVTGISLEDILKDEDVLKLVDAADHPRSKAMIMVLYESAAEAQELLNMKVKDFMREQEAAKVALHSGGAVRFIRIHYAVPYVLAWLYIHPKREDPDAPLWNMSYSNLVRVLRMAKREAGIKKPVSARALRHAGLTKWAKVMPEQLLKLYAGWRPDSKMAAIYVHLSGADLDEQMGKAYGEQPLEQKEYKIKVGDKSAEPIKCPRCEKENPFDAVFCLKCGLDLEPVPYDSRERMFLEIKKDDALGNIVRQVVEKYRKEHPEGKVPRQDSF
jgi:integrase/recombinase XerD